MIDIKAEFLSSERAVYGHCEEVVDKYIVLWWKLTPLTIKPALMLNAGSSRSGSVLISPDLVCSPPDCAIVICPGCMSASMEGTSRSFSI